MRHIGQSFVVHLSLAVLSICVILLLPTLGESQLPEVGSPEDAREGPPSGCPDGQQDLGCGCGHGKENSCKSCFGDLSCLDTETPAATPSPVITDTPAVTGTATSNASATPMDTPTIIATSVPDVCNGPGIETSAQTLNFSTTPKGTCNDGGDTRKLDQIRREKRPVTLPSYSRICSVKIRIPTTSFQYDDEFALTLDDVILAASYYPSPSTSNYPLQFDWGYVNGLYYRWDNPGSIPYCAKSKTSTGKLISAKKCTMPTGRGVTAIKKGTLSVDLGPETAQKLIESIKSKTKHELQMIGYGNGVTTSTGDCYHTAFSLTLEVSGLP